MKEVNRFFLVSYVVVVGVQQVHFCDLELVGVGFPSRDVIRGAVREMWRNACDPGEPSVISITELGRGDFEAFIGRSVPVVLRGFSSPVFDWSPLDAE